MFVVPWPPNSFYSGKEIKSTADFKGVKFRAFNPVTGRLAELMGAVPVTVQQSEVPQAFSTGVIQAMITSPATGVDTQAWDFVKYFYEVKAMAPWNITVVNERVFSRLDQKTQDAILAAAKAAEERGWKLQAEETGKLLDTLKVEGNGGAPAEPRADGGAEEDRRAAGRGVVEGGRRGRPEDPRSVPQGKLIQRTCAFSTSSTRRGLSSPRSSWC